MIELWLQKGSLTSSAYRPRKKESLHRGKVFIQVLFVFFVSLLNNFSSDTNSIFISYEERERERFYRGAHKINEGNLLEIF